MSKSRSGDGVYRRSDREGFWISWTDVQGQRRYRRTQATSLAQARASLAAERVRVEQARILGFNPPGEDLFSDVADKFLHYQQPRITVREFQREQLIVERHLKPAFSGKIAGIRRIDIDHFVTARSGKVAAGTVRKELMLLKRLFTRAVDWEILPVSPAARVSAPREPAGRLRYLTPPEMRLLLTECPGWLKPIVALAVSTGMRRSEILGLRWLDIDLRNPACPLIVLPQTKNGEGRIVYLNSDAIAAISSLTRFIHHSA